jgi:uncharacterized protein YjbI with pentapeptide repeats
MEDWKIFENDVAGLFTLQGYRVDRDVLISGKKVEIYAEKQVSQFTTEKLAIDCKYYMKTLPTEEVKEVIGIVPALIGSRECTEVVIVSNTRPSEYTARLIRDTPNLKCMTYEQLVNGVIDFTDYLWKFKCIFESNELLKSYIPLKASIGIDGTSFDLIDFLKSHLDKKDDPFNVCILGDFGTGKTSAAMMLTYLLMKEYQEKPFSSIIPIYIPLRDYARSFDVRAMITDHLVNAYSLRTDFSSFQMLLERGKLLVILDGFDEMAQMVDAETRKQHFIAIAELFRGKAKTIMTGRQGYFFSLADLKVMLKLVEKNTNVEKYPTIFIKPFSNEQISDFIKKQATFLKNKGIYWEEVRDLILKTDHLRDLSSRPVLLDMLVKMAPKVRENLTQLNTAELYRQYTDMWISRDQNKGEFRRLLSRDVKEKMMEELALDMYAQGVRTFDVDKLRASIKPIAESLNVSVIDRQFEYVEHDIRVCSFLTMDFKDNCYRFAHQSFFEYFVARALFNIIVGGLTHSILAKQYVTDEIFNFLIEMIKTEADVNDITENIRSFLSTSEQLKTMPMTQEGIYYFTNLLRLYCKLVGGFPKIKLNDVQLPSLNLENVNFKNADLSLTEINDSFLNSIQLSGLHVKKAKIKRCKFTNCPMNNSIFSDSTIMATNFYNCNLDNSNFSGSNIEGVEFKECKLGIASFIGANIKYTNFTDMDLTGCDFTGSHIDLDSVRMHGSNIQGVKGINPVNYKFFLGEAVISTPDLIFVPKDISRRLGR